MAPAAAASMTLASTFATLNPPTPSAVCGVVVSGMDAPHLDAALSAADAVPAPGPPPAEVSEPFTVMLWGITTDTVGEWLREGEGDGDGEHGQPGCGDPGQVEPQPAEQECRRADRQQPQAV